MVYSSANSCDLWFLILFSRITSLLVPWLEETRTSVRTDPALTDRHCCRTARRTGERCTVCVSVHYPNRRLFGQWHLSEYLAGLRTPTHHSSVLNVSPGQKIRVHFIVSNKHHHQLITCLESMAVKLKCNEKTRVKLGKYENFGNIFTFIERTVYYFMLVYKDWLHMASLLLYRA